MIFENYSGLLLINKQKFINIVSKLCLRFLSLIKLYELLLLSGLYVLRAKNGQRNFAERVDTKDQGSSDKNCLNILRSENPRRRGGLSIGNSNKKFKILQQEIGV